MVLPDYGEDGPELDEDLEHVGALTSEAHRVASQNEVARGRDRNELGRAFDQTKYCRSQYVGSQAKTVCVRVSNMSAKLASVALPRGPNA